MLKRLPGVLIVGFGLAAMLAMWAVMIGCANLPLKQKAVVGLQASETFLEASHNAERALCRPGADPTKAIPTCDGLAAAEIGLTDARHQQLAGLYSRAFDLQITAATALKVWRAGDPQPTSLVEYERALNEIVNLIVQFMPASEPTAVQLEAAQREAGRASRQIGGQR